MKKLKKAGLLAVAVAALMTFVLAGTASAVEFYSGNTTLKKGTKLHTTLIGTTTVFTTSGTVVLTCTQETYEEEIIVAGGAGLAAFTKGTQISIGGCTMPTSILSGGELSFTWTEGLNATITASGFEETVNTAFGSCTYSEGSETAFGTLFGTESGEATEKIESVITKKAGSVLCPTTLRWTATHIVTTPKNFSAKGP